MESVQVVIQTAFLGDLLLTIPFLQRLKKKFPNDKIIIVCKQGLGSFLKELGVVDEFYEIVKNDSGSYHSALQFLSTYKISKLFCVHRSFRSLLFAKRIKSSYKVGYKTFLGYFVFSEMFRYQQQAPDAIRKFTLLKGVDADTEVNLQNLNIASLNVAQPQGKLPKVPRFFSFPELLKNKNREKKICLFPGSVWATKRWTKSGFIESAKKLNSMGYQIQLLGGSDEKELCEEIAKDIPQAQVLAGQLSIMQSIQMISESQLVIANDSAATHMAALTKTPSVTVFGPTTLALGFRPWSNLSRVVENNDLDCRPCGKHGHQKCPLGHHNCMNLISANEVIQRSLELLKTNYP